MKPRTSCVIGLALALAFGGAAQATMQATQPSCKVSAGTQPPRIVELYTSEGCSSCPPADRWLSTLKGRPEVIALAFHVNYWDKLGWPDRFASPQFTQRQRDLMRASGSAYVYTPQVMVDGNDWRGWRGAGLPSATTRAPTPAPALEIVREGSGWRAEIGAATQALAGYWALVEDRHASAVRAGENAGETLRHDHVVREFAPVAAWPAGRTQRLSWKPVTPPNASNPRRVVFVVTDAAGNRPLQAAALGC